MSKREEVEIEQERRKILQDVFVTEIKKKKFIDKIKNEWSNSMMEEPNKVQTTLRMALRWCNQVCPHYERRGQFIPLDWKYLYI